MAQTLKFDLVSPERRMASGAATVVTAPGVEGDFGAMPGHAPFLTTLRPGVVTATMEGAAKRYVVFGGFAEVGPEHCTILADEVLDIDALEPQALEGRIAAAREALAAAVNDEVPRRAQILNDLEALATLR